MGEKKSRMLIVWEPLVKKRKKRQFFMKYLLYVIECKEYLRYSYNSGNQFIGFYSKTINFSSAAIVYCCVPRLKVFTIVDVKDD
jgi:hypothetical protein